MGLPNILISFKTAASQAVRRGNKGIIAVIVIDTVPIAGQLSYILGKAEDIPQGLTHENTKYLERAFIEGEDPIKHVVLIVADTVEAGIVEVEKHPFDYLVAPHDIVDTAPVVAFIKDMRQKKKIMVKGVLPHSAIDDEGIINFTTDNIKVKGEDGLYKASEYCTRIAGLIVTTPLTQSVTYKALSEVEDVPKYTKEALDNKINKGELLIFHDGQKVKVGRGVNSLTTYTTEKGEDYKWIKIVATTDMIYEDVKRTFEDNYVGRVPNNFDNKNILATAIGEYLEELSHKGILDKGISVAIDVVAQGEYLKKGGTDITMMSDLEIKEGNTDTFVFLTGKYRILNAVEDIVVSFYI